MFDFQKEVIINSADQFCLVTEKMLDDTSETNNPVYLHVNRCMEYYPEYIAGEGVSETAGHTGEPERIVFSFLSYADNSVTFPASRIFKIDLELTNDEPLADYANPWSKFSKKISFEFTAENPKDDYGKSIAKAVAKALSNHGIHCNYPGFLEGGFDLDFREQGYYLKKAKCYYQTYDGEWIEDLIIGITADSWYKDIYERREFATGDWLIKNLRFPTHSTTGYYALAKDEAPIPGEIYTQFTFQYAVPRRGLSGMNAVGQRMMSVTTHTFYVRGRTGNGSDPAGLFKQALSTLRGQSASPTSADIEGPAAYNPEEEMPAYTPEEGNENPTVNEE